MSTRLGLILAAVVIAAAIARPANAAPIGAAAGDLPAAASGDLVQPIHGFHCRLRYSKRLGWHRHWRACKDWEDRHPDRMGCWIDIYGRWHCMDRQRHRHPKGCIFTPTGIYCTF